MNLVDAQLFFLGGATLFAALPALGPRSERWRRVLRRMYTSPMWPLAMRGSVGVYPIMALACAVIGLGVLLPQPLAQWAALAFVDLMGLALILACRTPPPFTPRFLRDEIAARTVPLQRPDWFDRLVLALLVAGVIYANVFFPLLIFGYLGS